MMTKIKILFCATLLVEIFSTVLLAAPPADSLFRLYDDNKNIEIKMAQPANSPPWIRGTFEVEANAQKVIELLVNFKNYETLFQDSIKQVDLLKYDTEMGAPYARFHFVWHYTFPYKDRDGIALYKVSWLSDGTGIISWQSDPRESDDKEIDRTKWVPIQRVEGETRVVPISANRCRVIYTYCADLGGEFPGWVEKLARKKPSFNYQKAIYEGLGLTAP